MNIKRNVQSSTAISILKVACNNSQTLSVLHLHDAHTLLPVLLLMLSTYMQNGCPFAYFPSTFSSNASQTAMLNNSCNLEHIQIYLSTDNLQTHQNLIQIINSIDVFRYTEKTNKQRSNSTIKKKKNL